MSDLKVIISSTARDLPEHRKDVMDACLRQGMFPMMMEHLPAADADAIAESLRIVDEADIYLGVFAHRYGYVPKGHDISITENGIQPCYRTWHSAPGLSYARRSFLEGIRR